MKSFNRNFLIIFVLLIFTFVFSGCNNGTLQSEVDKDFGEAISSITIDEGYQWNKVEWNGTLDEVEDILSEKLNEVKIDDSETSTKTVYESKDVIKEKGIYFTLNFVFDNNALSSVTLSTLPEEKPSFLTEGNFALLLEAMRYKFGDEEDIISSDMDTFLLETYLWKTINVNEKMVTRMQVDKIMKEEKLYGISIILFHY